MSNIVSKLSVKAIKANPKLAAVSDKEVFMGRFIGTLTGTKTGEDGKGMVYTALVGDFAAYNEHGEEYRSGIMFLPAGMHDQLIGAIVKAEGKPLEFAIDVFAVKADNPIGYSYVGKTVLEREAEDSVARMAKALPTLPSNKALPAPAKKTAHKK